MSVVDSKFKMDYDNICNIVLSYIEDTSCKSPTEFFCERGFDSNQLGYIRATIYSINPKLYESFAASWYKKNIERKNRIERKNKQRIAKILYLIENVEDFDILEFWKLIPYDGDEDFLYKTVNFVKNNFGEKYYSFVSFLSSKRILEDSGFFRIDPEQIRSNPTSIGDKYVSAASNQFIISYMEKYNIPKIGRAYYDVLESYLNDRDKIIRDVYGMGSAKVKKKQISN